MGPGGWAAAAFLATVLLASVPNTSGIGSPGTLSLHAGRRAAEGGGAGATLRLRGGAFWLCSTAEEAEINAFWRLVSIAPPAWIRDNLQKMCPFSRKEAAKANEMTRETMEAGQKRLRGGGQAHSKLMRRKHPPTSVFHDPLDDEEMDEIPFAQPGDRVAVTGAGGYVAQHIIKQLLAKGYTVHGTVRNLTDTAKVLPLRRQFPGLLLFQADLMRDGSFMKAFRHCKFVIHAASPFKYTVRSPQKDLVDPAVVGTMNVMRCARLVGGVRRLIITSSAAAVLRLAVPADRAKRWCEDDWNVDTTIEDNPYRFSKVLAEQCAWIYMAQCYNSYDYGSHGRFTCSEDVAEVLDAGGCIEHVSYDLVTINPSFVVGPPVGERTDGESVSLIKDTLEGKYYEGGAKGGVVIGAVDVRDVAAAHIAAMENRSAYGRYLLSSDSGVSHLDMCNMLAQDPVLGRLKLPTVAREPTDYVPCYDTRKAQNGLGITFRPISKTLVDMAKDLIRKGIISDEGIKREPAPAL